MATPPGFYNPVDQAIYSAGDFFIPQERFRAAPYNVNAPAEDDPATAGLPAVYRPQGGGGGIPFTEGIGDLTTSFQTAVDNRQNRLRDLNRPMGIIPGQRGDEIIMERLAPIGAPADLYEGSIEGIPQTIKGAPGIFTREEPTLGRKIQDAFYNLPFTPNKPQTAEMIMEQGYTGRAGGPGILGMMLGSIDKYGSLPRPDQAFIAANMGYTGPTVFGENTSGGNKDPFGLNVRSAFGNYAERVGTEATKLGDLLSGKQADKYGKGTSGISFNPATGMFEADDDDDAKAKAAALKATQMNKMNIAKYNYYTQKTQERDEFRRQEEQRQIAEAKAIQNANRRTAGTSKATGGYQSSFAQDRDFMEGPGGGRPGGGGYGGGADLSSTMGSFMDGGIVDLVDIYD